MASPDSPSSPDELAWFGPMVEAWEQSRQAMSIYDDQDRLRWANPVYRENFMGGLEGDVTFEEVLRHCHAHGIGTVIECGDIDAFIADLYTRRRKVGPNLSFETDLVDGRWFFMNQTVLPNGWILNVGTDITALKNNERTLREAAQTDPLTGLPNRRRMYGLLDAALAEMVARPLYLAMVDIDRFKDINDRFGHPVGDQVLKHFAGVAQERLGDRGWIGRIGGEEFMVLLCVGSLGEAEGLLATLQQDIPPLPLGPGRSTVRYTVSAGLADAAASDGADAIVQRADRALYAAKSSGRDRLAVRTREDELAGKSA